MKKFFKITGITIAVLLALMIILPIVFKGKIVEQIKIAINENVNAEVDFGTFRISFFRNFPDVSFRLNDLSVVGVDHFQGDTLASVKSFFISVNLRSLFGDEGYEIKSIRVDNPRIMAKVLKDGRANWDIVPEDEPIDDEITDTEDVAFKIALRRFQINNGYVVYDDREMDMYARLVNFNHTLSGDFTADFTSIAIRNTTIESLLVRFEGIPYINGVFAELTADIDADLNNFEFTFRDNSFRLNDLSMVFDGTFAMPGDDMVMDFTFASPRTDFKAFLSMIPAIYTADFEGLQTSGTLAFNGFVKGIYNEDNIPGFGVSIDVDNGMFQYPDLPAAVTDVFIRTKIENPGGDADFTVVDVSRFSLNMAGNQVEARLNLKTPVSDPQIDAFLKGKMDLSKVRDFYPMEEGEALSGIIESDMTAKGRMSSIENERYNEFVFTGNFLVNGLNYTSEFFPQGIEIASAEMNFSPRFADLRNFSMKIGDSDLSASGRIDNILGYALSDELLTGRFETRSNYFNLNQFMDDEPTPDTEEPLELSVIEVPENIDFNLQSRFGKIVFGDLEITNATGAIRVADQTVSMNNLRMELLGGSMTLNGSYATHDITRPVIDFDMNISRFDIAQTFTTFNTFAAIAPIGERASGRFNAGFRMQSALDEKLEPILTSLAGGGTFSSAAITIENSPALVGLADQLRMDMFRQVNVRDVNVNFAFIDGRVEVQPFDLNIGRSQATLSGNHGFDQTINYLMGMAIPRAEFGGAANQVLDNLVSQAAGRGLAITPSETVNVGVAFTGTVNEPRISVSLAETAGEARQQVMDAIEDAVRDVVDETRERVEDAVDDVREQVSEELQRRANQVVAEAERQAQTIRREAKSTADAIRKEAREQAKNLENEASGTIAKAAARRTGEQMIKSADERAANLEKEADERATRIVREANQQADRIRAGEE
ncbi:MAG: AsmA family protein [Bacteroidetes bacterium]|nr:MAG: AsmA family protein [Bacteroidota bacterium]